MRALSAIVGVIVLVAATAAMTFAALPSVLADGKLMPPRDYRGSLEERSQEAIIIFQGSDRPGGATEDLILKIAVTRRGEELAPETFGWVVPLPQPPVVAKEDPRLFRECFEYVEEQLREERRGLFFGANPKAAQEQKSVSVVSRETVGSYDVAVVREIKPGALNAWLGKEGFQTLPKGDDVIAYYRRRGYVFACMKVTDAVIEAGKTIDLHPLRFTFKTGGRDGIYFPMKMTGLQREPFSVNLYIFSRRGLNGDLNEYGYAHRGFQLRYGVDGREPQPGELWWSPEHDPILKYHQTAIPTLAKLFHRLHPRKRFHLTNIQAANLKPGEVRDWPDDLWLFLAHGKREFVPFDARPGGPAAGGRERD